MSRRQFTLERVRPGRVCVLSLRGCRTHVSRTPTYQFEDIVCDIEDATLLSPPVREFSTLTRVARRVKSRIGLPNSRTSPIADTRISGGHDLFFVACQNLGDLHLLKSLGGWKESCRKSACWIDEVWLSWLPDHQDELGMLAEFDYVFLNFSGTLGSIQSRVKPPCFHMPFGVDAIRFCPHPSSPSRSIYVHNYGRRSESTHQALLKLAAEKQFYYVYDTVSNPFTPCPGEHRALLAETLMRSRYFIANRSKFDEPSVTLDQHEFGPRCFEGSAAGAIMVGDPPRNEAFRQHFDWPDAVIETSFDAPHIGELLAELDSQPKRLERIRNAGIVNSLMRHDWAYRWRFILETAGLKPMPELLAREERLKLLAAEVSQLRPRGASRFPARTKSGTQHMLKK